MSQEILTKIISTKDRGLIGITEGGKEVPLSAPKPELCYLRREEREKLTSRFGKEKSYVQLPDNEGSHIDIPYPINIYTRRISRKK